MHSIRALDRLTEAKGDCDLCDNTLRVQVVKKAAILTIDCPRHGGC